MSFFSKLTADTRESIPCVPVRPGKDVYLLQPNGLPPIKGSNYHGDGLIGEVDWFIWLATINAAHLGFNADELSQDELRAIGISLDVGTITLDTETNEYWSIYQDHRIAANKPDAHFFPGTFATVIPGLNQTPNQLMKSGRFKRVRVRDITSAPYSIKLSHNKDAKYEDLPRSQECPFQGFMYPDEMLQSANLVVPEE
jgi:hypothetical protein